MTSRFSPRPLINLGLTVLESEVYAYLLENSPATGYRVAKFIGKPTANTYKALRSLQDKGAVIIEESTNRLCRAVPMDEFLDALERRFLNSKDEAQKELAKLKPAPDDERLYYLHTPDQVFERLRQMLQRCRYIALLDLFPWALDQIKDDVESAASRGIRTAAKVYRPCEIPGVEVVIAPEGNKTMERWPGQWANGVVDGKEHLLAFFSRDGARVLQAVWSSNTYTSWVYHSSMMHELLHGVLSEDWSSLSGNLNVPEQYQRLQAMKAEEALGYWTLVERFGETEDKS